MSECFKSVLCEIICAFVGWKIEVTGMEFPSNKFLETISFERWNGIHKDTTSLSHKPAILLGEKKCCNCNIWRFCIRLPFRLVCGLLRQEVRYTHLQISACSRSKSPFVDQYDNKNFVPVKTPFETGKLYYSAITTKIGNKLVARTTNLPQIFIKKGEGELYCTRFFVFKWKLLQGNYWDQQAVPGVILIRL